MIWQGGVRTCNESPLSALYDRQTMPTALPVNWLFATLLLQHRFHFVQAIDCRAHLRLISYARSFRIHDAAAKIHLHLALFLGDDGLNDRRGLLWSGVGLA